MTEIQQEEKQQELFLEFSGSSKRPQHFPSLAKTHKPILLSTTIEQVILVGIGLILVGCFVFFLGVLRGKSLSMRASQFPAQKRVPVAAMTVQKTAASPIVVMKPEARAVAANNHRQEQVQDLNKPYTIEVIRYRKQAQAEKEAVMLRRSGFYTTIIAGNGYYAVCVGQYATKDAAKKDLKIFSAKYKDSFLRRRS